MSRAFVREEDVQQPDALPELKVSDHPNFVTRRGLELIDGRIAELIGLLAQAADEATTARLQRDLRYWTSRRETAQLRERSPDDDEVGFGTRVRFRRDDDEPEEIEIVGEDEADPAHRRLSFAAPLARAMMGARVGEVVTFTTPQRSSEMTILAIEAL
jgi:transcription elongation factor GreB